MKLPPALLEALRLGGGVAVALTVGCRTTPHVQPAPEGPVAATSQTASAPVALAVEAPPVPSTLVSEPLSSPVPAEPETVEAMVAKPGGANVEIAIPPAPTAKPAPIAKKPVAKPLPRDEKPWQCLACGMG